ncbi:hypothetical protein N9496_01880 [Akkermansiaceae bacterium]|nr:hypothetical protein [Akkermansiaceae bacterium]
MTFLGKMMHAKSKLLPLAVAVVIAPLLLSENAAAQDVNIHPSDLFETPQEGIETALPRSSRDSDSWKDYTHLSLNASIRGESNVFLDNQENEQSDTIFTIAPTLSFTTPGIGSGDQKLSVYYTPSYRIYSNNSDLNDLDHTFRFSFDNDSQITLPKTTISFDLGYDQTQSSDRLNGGLVGRESINAGVRVSHNLTGKTNLNLSANAQSNSYDNSSNSNGGNNNADLLDDFTYNLRASLTYQVTSKISVGPYVGYGITDISGSGGGVENTQDRTNYSAGITGTYEASGKTAFTGSLGWSTYEFDGPGAGDGEHSLTYRIGLSHQLGPRTSMRASIWSDYKPSNSIGNTSYTSTGASLSLSWRPSDRWSHSLSVTYENDDYFSDDAAGGTGTSDYLSISLGSNYRFNNGLSLGARISSSTQNNDNTNDEALNDFENWIFSINANYIFW